MNIYNENIIEIKMNSTKWIQFSESKFVNSSIIGDCYVTQLFPDYKWRVKCDDIRNSGRYLIYDKEFDTKEEAIKALDSLRHTLNSK